MKLYYAQGSCALSPHIVLKEAGLVAELVRVDLATHTYGGGDFYAVNPKGYVPALELDNGERLTEGPVIVQYLADQAPDTALAPKAGTFERYRVQEWLNFISTEIHKSFSLLFNAKTPDEFKQVIREKLGTRFDYLVKQLSARPHLMGATFGIADAYLFAMLRWAPGRGLDLAKWPELKAYFERIKARPRVVEAMSEESLPLH